MRQIPWPGGVSPPGPPPVATLLFTAAFWFVFPLPLMSVC
jgi:hypothetical protein